MKTYIVLHHEIMERNGHFFDDEVVFYTASTLANALRLIRKSTVARFSWWEIQVHETNGSEWPERVGLYGPRGGKLRKSFDEFVAIYKKEGVKD